jgi:cation:H+ antiporter
MGNFMFTSTIFLVLSLAIILFAAEGFTNGVEIFGKRFSFSQAVVGSILAAVGTALPETILPIVAISSGNRSSVKDIGVGAILGAPFMLSSVAFFLIGITVISSHLRKHHRFEILVEPDSTKRDLGFFILMYSVAIFLPLVTARLFIVPIVVFLLAGYIYYINLTIKGKSAKIEHFEGLHLLKLQKKLGLATHDTPHITLILLQVIVALAVMVLGAHMFVGNLEHISLRLGMSPLLFSLMLAPVATELPEKFNSVTWILKNKDTLAVGNITGAMVFQATFPVSIGLLFTPWKIEGAALTSAIFAIVSACIVLVTLATKKRLSPLTMLLGGVFYFVYIIVLISNLKS